MRIIIEGKPIAKKSVRLGKYGAYNSQKKYMDGLKMLVKVQWKGEPLEGAVKLVVTYFMPIPKSTPKKSREGMKWHTKRPDSDNLTKMIKDCMSGIVYKDDSQVADEHYKKIYSDDPRTVIDVEKL